MGTEQVDSDELLFLSFFIKLNNEYFYSFDIYGSLLYTLSHLQKEDHTLGKGIGSGAPPT